MVMCLAAGGIDTSTGFTSLRGSVSVLDAVTGALVRTLEVGSVPLTVLGSGAVPSARQALAVDSTSGRVYVAAADSILVLDGSTGTMRQTLALSAGTSPQIPSPSTVAVSAQAKRLYVGDGYDADISPPATRLGFSGGSLAVLDGATNRGISNVVLGQQGVGAIAVDERAHRVLVVEPRGALRQVTVDVLDARTGALLRTTNLNLVGGGDCAIGVDRMIARAFVLYAPSGYELGNGASETVSVLDTRSGQVLQTVQVRATSRAAGYFLGQSIAVDQRTARVFVAAAQGEFGGSAGVVRISDVSVLDARSGRILSKLSVGVGPQDVAIDEIARRVFVTNEHDNTLSVFDATRL